MSEEIGHACHYLDAGIPLLIGVGYVIYRVIVVEDLPARFPKLRCSSVIPADLINHQLVTQLFGTR